MSDPPQPSRRLLARALARARSPLGKSTSALYAIHLAGYLLPLASFPYLLRVLGPSAFGLYAFAIAIARYGLLVTDWGYAYTATRDLSQQKMRGQRLDRTFSATMAGRVTLLSVCAVVLLALTLFVPRFSSDASLYWAVFAGVAGSAFFPVWLFQASGRLPAAAGIQLATRVVSTALIFVLVRTQGDVDIALWLWSAPWIASAVIALWFARYRLGIRWVGVRVRETLATIRGGGAVFTSMMASSLYTAANVVFLGLLSNDAQVGYFAAAETVIIAAVGLIGPLSQILFPRSAEAAEGGPQGALRHARSIAPLLIGLGLLLGLAVFIGAPVLGPIIFGPDFGPSIALLQVMSVIPLAVAVATVLGPQLMLTLRMDSRYATVILLGGVLNVALTLMLVPAFLATGTAVAATVTEVTIAIVLFLVVMRHGLNPLTGRVTSRSHGSPDA